MVVFLPHGTVVPKADKVRQDDTAVLAPVAHEFGYQGSIIRAKVYDTFESEISKAYRQLEGDGDLADSDKTAVGASSDLQAYLLALVRREGVDLDTDLFSAGLDSLQANMIRNALQRFSICWDYTAYSVDVE